MIPWDLISLAKKQSVQELCRKAQKIIKHCDTSAISIADYPSVQNYIVDKFPRINLSCINIYVTSNKAMDLVGFRYMGGCYIDLLKTIFVLDDVSLNNAEKISGRFGKLLSRNTKATLHVEDVLVHEVMHAVSSVMQRATREYEYAEEEFVYTHCVDYYRDNGMLDEQIIDRHFLPFCLNDILQDKKELSEIFARLKKAKLLRIVPWEIEYTQNSYVRFIDRHAEYLVPEIIEMARARARFMIECYEKYGCRSMSAEDVDHSASVRFQNLNFE